MYLCRNKIVYFINLSLILGFVAVTVRLEGTPAYLPPEILTSQITGQLSHQLHPSHAAWLVDAWSFGCLIYFCLHGRPLYYGDAQQVRRLTLVFVIWRVIFCLYGIRIGVIYINNTTKLCLLMPFS